MRSRNSLSLRTVCLRGKNALNANNLSKIKEKAEAMGAEARKEADAAMAMAKPPDASMAEMKRKQADAAMAFAKPSDAIMAELKMALGAGSCKLSTMTSKKTITLSDEQ